MWKNLRKAGDKGAWLGISPLLSSGDQSRDGLQEPLWLAPIERNLSFKICYDPVKFRNQRASMAESTTRFGFVAFAETWNGRLAMLGFVIGLGTELLTGQGILGQLGLG